MGKLVLYMLNLIKTLNVIMKKSDTDFTGVLTSTGFVLTVPPDRAGLLCYYNFPHCSFKRHFLEDLHSNMG